MDSSSSGGYLSSITVDLGKVTNPNAVITKSCTVSLDLGELAQTIAKKGKEQNWGATFQVNFSGIPSGTSGGGNVDVNALLSQGETKDAAKQGTNIRFGIRADAYSAPYVPMMEEHKNDTEIKETVANTNAGTDAASTGNSGVPTEVKNSYLFTVEKLEDTEENKDLTEEEQAKALSEQYLKHFIDGTYDLILVTPQETEALYQNEKDAGEICSTLPCRNARSVKQMRRKSQQKNQEKNQRYGSCWQRKLLLKSMWQQSQRFWKR